jgi:hypothetical protein
MLPLATTLVSLRLIHRNRFRTHIARQRPLSAVARGYSAALSETRSRASGAQARQRLLARHQIVRTLSMAGRTQRRHAR